MDSASPATGEAGANTASSATGESGANLADLLQTVGVDHRSVIRIAGRDGLPSLLWLCRHGYDSVGWMRGGAPCPAERIDALIIPHAGGAETLVEVLGRAPRVREGGALVVRVDVAAADAGPAVDGVLRRFGYEVLTHHRRGGHLVSLARRRSPAPQAAAA